MLGTFLGSSLLQRVVGGGKERWIVEDRCGRTLSRDWGRAEQGIGRLTFDGVEHAILSQS